MHRKYSMSRLTVTIITFGAGILVTRFLLPGMAHGIQVFQRKKFITEDEDKVSMEQALAEGVETIKLYLEDSVARINQILEWARDSTVTEIIEAAKQRIKKFLKKVQGNPIDSDATVIEIIEAARQRVKEFFKSLQGNPIDSDSTVTKIIEAAKHRVKEFLKSLQHHPSDAEQNGLSPETIRTLEKALDSVCRWATDFIHTTQRFRSLHGAVLELPQINYNKRKEHYTLR